MKEQNIEAQEIAYKYEHGKTIADLAAEYRHGTAYINKVLKEQGIKKRTCGETAILRRVNFEYTLNEIGEKVVANYLAGNGLISSGKEFGLSEDNVKYFLKKNNIPIRNFSEAATRSNQNRALYKNEHFFSIESRDMAWVMGFIAADGNISKRNNRIKITLARRDREILEKIRDLIEIENPISDHTTHDGYDCSTLTWSCAQHKSDLAKYSIVPDKTFILKPPYDLNKEYWIDYIRGYFDGDGSVNLIGNSNKRGYGNLRWQICSATEEMLIWIRDTLDEQFNIAKVNIQVSHREKKNPYHHPLYYLQYSSISTKNIYDILYTDSSMFLKRKKEYFENILFYAEHYNDL